MHQIFWRASIVRFYATFRLEHWVIPPGWYSIPMSLPGGLMMDPDDKSLFLDAMADVKPLKTSLHYTPFTKKQQQPPVLMMMNRKIRWPKVFWISCRARRRLFFSGMVYSKVWLINCAQGNIPNKPALTYCASQWKIAGSYCFVLWWKQCALAFGIYLSSTVKGGKINLMPISFVVTSLAG